MDILPDILAGLLPLLTAFCGWAAAKLKSNRKEEEALKKGVKGLLRAKVIDLWLHYIDAKAIPRTVWKLCGAAMTRIWTLAMVTLQFLIL